MGPPARMVLILASGLWAGATGAGETIWEGAVRMVDERTLAGQPDGPVLPLDGIEPPPPDARCGPAEETLTCKELAALALRDMVAGQHLVCERRPPAQPSSGQQRGQEGDGVACRADGMDIAEWMVRMGWALAGTEALREAEREARATRQGMWWYEEEHLVQANDAPPARFVPPFRPGEDAARACMEAGGNAFARREYGNLMAIEAVEWLIEETRLQWERRHPMEGDGADPTPEALDGKTREALDAAQQLCELLGGASAGSGDATEGGSGKAIGTLEGRVGRLADRSRETCWEAAAGAARAGRIEELTGMRQIARHTMRRTERLGERLWQARDRGDDEEARRVLGQAYTAFESAQRQCGELAAD